MWCQLSNQLVIGNMAGLWEAMHAFADFDVDGIIVDKWCKICTVP
jgi:hypothetical protein